MVKINFPRVVIGVVVPFECSAVGDSRRSQARLGSNTAPLHKSASLFLRNLLPLGLFLSPRRRRGGCFALHHAHLLLVFLEQRRAAGLAHLLLARDAGTHFLRQVECSAHLPFPTGRGLSAL